MISSENLLFCVVHYILPLYSSYYFSQEITFGRDNRLNFAPLSLGQREPGQGGGGRPFRYKDHTAWPPLPSNLQCVDISHTNPSERKYLVYYLVLSLCNKACHHIHQMKGFLSYLFYQAYFNVLVYQKNKKYQGGGNLRAGCSSIE